MQSNWFRWTIRVSSICSRFETMIGKKSKSAKWIPKASHSKKETMKVKRTINETHTHYSEHNWRSKRISRIFQSEYTEKQRYICKTHSTANSTTTMKFSFSVFFVLAQQTHTKKKHTRIYSDIPCSFSLSQCFVFHFVLHCTIYPPYDFFFIRCVSLLLLFLMVFCSSALNNV